MSVQLKNIQKIQVMMFEVNTDNYYRKNMAPFTSDINLDGLVPQDVQEFSYSDLPSNQRHTETFSFVIKRRGLFVIEIIGNGISVRAIIQKGSLTLVHKSTIAGHFAFIINEDKEVCSGYTGLLFDNVFYPSDKTTGRILIPFGRNKTSGKAIIM